MNVAFAMSAAPADVAAFLNQCHFRTLSHEGHSLTKWARNAIDLNSLLSSNDEYGPGDEAKTDVDCSKAVIPTNCTHTFDDVIPVRKQFNSPSAHEKRVVICVSFADHVMPVFLSPTRSFACPIVLERAAVEPIFAQHDFGFVDRPAIRQKTCHRFCISGNVVALSCTKCRVRSFQSAHKCTAKWRRRDGNRYEECPYNQQCEYGYWNKKILRNK